MVGRELFQGGCAWFGEVEWREGAFRETGLHVLSCWRGCWLAWREVQVCFGMANSVAAVVHSVVAHHKDSECAAVLYRSGAECARDGEKLKSTGRCCLLHLDGAPSPSDDAAEVDAQAVVQAPVGVVVE